MRAFQTAPALLAGFVLLWNSTRYVWETHLTRLLTLPVVEQMIALGHSRIYEKLKAGEFPRPFQLSANAVRCKESEIVEWMSKLSPTGQAD